MRIYQSEDYQAMSRRAANILSAHVILKPDCVLGLATGSTPIGAYQQLIEWYRKGDLSFAETRTVNLDEYCGLAPTHEQSYRRFMQTNFFDHIDVRLENTHVPNGLAEDLEAECARYNRVIQELGGIDLQLLGMGHNGHIGFNDVPDIIGLNQNPAQTGVDLVLFFYFWSKNKTNRGEPSFSEKRRSTDYPPVERLFPYPAAFHAHTYIGEPRDT